MAFALGVPNEPRVHSFDLRAERTLIAHLEGTTSSGRAPRDPAGLEVLRRRHQDAIGAIYAWLDANSRRSWSGAVPDLWVCTDRTFDDATTPGYLSVVPPLPFGITAERQRRLLTPLRRRSC